MNFDATTVAFKFNFYWSKWSNGFIYVTPLPVIVCPGVNDVLFNRDVNDTIPVFAGSMRVLFLTINGIEICWRYSLCDA